MSDPFPLSAADARQFVGDAGADALSGLPSWGGIIRWHNRYVLVFPKYDGSFALTDISGGVPDARVPGGMIPITAFVAAVPTQQSSYWETFLYSLPSNFYDVAIERAKQLAEGTEYVAGAVGTAAGALTKPLLENLTVPLIVIGVLFLFMNAKK
jgi:hypothetical protein